MNQKEQERVAKTIMYLCEAPYIRSLYQDIHIASPADSLGNMLNLACVITHRLWDQTQRLKAAQAELAKLREAKEDMA